MAACEWVARTRNYGKEQRQLSFEAVSDHPLKPTAVITRESSTPKKSSLPLSGSTSPAADPLSTIQTKADAFEGLDPLSMFAAQEVSSKLPANTPVKKKERSAEFDKLNQQDEFFEPWSSKRSGILAKYTTSEKLSITTSFLSSSDKDKYVIKQQTTVTDKVKHRLEELDDLEEGSVKEMLNLGQQDYIKRIEELNQALINAWETDQRVKALKIAIQCAKLLADVSVIQFYPSKFVLITDILDTFGKLVYERIFRKSSTFSSGSNLPTMLPENFTPDQVPDSAKETCRNWFYKIASVRELVPRFYVETAILKSYNFLTTGEFSQALVRLTKIIRGMGDPLVAVYARTYICRVGVLVAPNVKEHLIENLFSFIACYKQLKIYALVRLTKIIRGMGDPLVAVYARTYICRVGVLVAPNVKEHLIENLFSFIACYKQLQSDTVQNTLAEQQLEMPQYLQLYPPALDWILQCIAQKSPESTINDILDRCKEECNSALLLNSIITAFKPEYIAERALQFTELIRNCEEAGFPKANALASFVSFLLFPFSLFITFPFIDFGRDFEKQLDSFVDARSSFSNLETVLVMLVQSVNLLAMRTREVVKGNHTRKTASFIRACVAYCFITIPSIEDVFMRLKLYLLSGQVAMANQALSQADAFFQASISLISEAPRTIEIDHKMKPSEPYLLEYLNNFFSTLLVVPDSPDQGALHLVRGLLNVVQDYSWELNGGSKMSVYLNAVSLLSAMSQEYFIYHIVKVDSNDKLYGCDKKFLAEINQIVSTLIEAVLEHLKSLTSGEELKRQAAVAIGFFNRMLCHADFTQPQLTNLALNLWNLTQKHGFGSTKYTIRSLEYVKQKGASGNKELAAMAQKMKLQTRA
ncbi:PREDICTED: UPF0505 protein C16orf62 homolog [Acropora digitifera]|uniref:UPF0505 protein C16orf62 homolog n=1 Tax=Acropora digitifera TaxID=70779 RepID=UPI00077ACA74|nr:PREDICTED: UPF0505 protein C16orf62 homolog [Acropora digitifera]